MKVIDLLNKIANGEEVPKRIIYEGEVYKYLDVDCLTGQWNYKCYETKEYLFNNDGVERNKCILNKKLEILGEKEDASKKIEKIHDIIYAETPVEIILKNKINEIIDYINKGE